MAFSGPLEDRMLIRELFETYANGVMEGNAEEWGSVWAKDAYWALPEWPGLDGFQGREAIVKAWVDSMKVYALADSKVPMIYVATPGAINVTGDTATAHAFTSEIFRDPDSQKEMRVRGRYDDELAKIDGRWYFTRRVYRILHIA